MRARSVSLPILLAVFCACILGDSAARADAPPPPTMEHATAQASIPHPSVSIPAKGAAQVGIHAGSPGAPNASWLYPTAPHDGFDAVRVTLSPRSYVGDKNAIYWAYDSVFMDNQTYYMGLQPDGELGKTALFSVFGEGTIPKSAACKSGADRKAGSHCHIHYEWQLGHAYQFTVALVAADAATATWEGAVFDLDTGERTLIGDIAVPASRGYLKTWAKTFAEYFKHIDHCSQVPKSEALFFRPVGYRKGQEYLGALHALNVDSGCDQTFYSDRKDWAYVDVGE